MLSNEDLSRIIGVGIQLSTEHNKAKLIEVILDTLMDISHSDAGNLYLYHDDKLYYSMIKHNSHGINKGLKSTVDMAPLEMNDNIVCSYVAIHRQMINIPDIYKSNEFDFSEYKNYDLTTDYHTQSMIVFPMENIEGSLVGVIQLINSLDSDGNITSYDNDDELMLRALGSQAAVALSNMLGTEEIRELLHSFVEAFATAVDARTPYNGNHTRKVTSYALQLARYINELNEKGICNEYFDDNRLEQLELAAMLHDIGKMVIPLNIMNKATRLGDGIDVIARRFEQIRSYYEIDYLKGRISLEQYNEEQDYLINALDVVKKADSAGVLSIELLDQIKQIEDKVYIKEDNSKIYYLTFDEAHKLKVRRGTLTKEERSIMEDHVVMTNTILSKVRFTGNYSNVPIFAAQHHEFLNGKGYPKHLTEEDLPLESRILTVADIYDALTCTDRPYKKPIAHDKAMIILHDMADKEGKIDSRIVNWLEESFQKAGELVNDGN